MQIYSNNVKNGYLQDEFGGRSQQLAEDKKPNRSFHIAWKDLPANTVSLALVFIDHDAIPVCGFSWIHWIVANIEPKLGELPENASLDMHLLEGMTSWGSKIVPAEWGFNKDRAIGFGGCMPPDKPHKYTIKVYALDTKLTLQRGFYLNELLWAMEGHVLAMAKLDAMYNN